MARAAAIGSGAGLVLCALALAACAHSHDPLKKAAEALRARTDPDSLVTAAVLDGRSHSANRLALLHRAALASGRPEYLWLEASACSREKSCDPLAPEEAFRRSDPGNGAGWLGPLQRASEKGDDAGIDAALTAIGKTLAVNFYHSLLTIRISQVLTLTGEMEANWALMFAIGQPNGGPSHVAMSAMQACDGKALERPSRLTACRAAATSFQAGDSLLFELTGNGIALRAWPTDSSEYRAAEESGRIYRYRTQMLRKQNQLFLPMLPDVKQATAYLDLLSRYPRELDRMAAKLTALHIDPMPTPGWTAQ